MTTKPLRKTRPALLGLIAIGLAAAALSGCVGQNASAAPLGTLYVKDAPDDVKAVKVTFTLAQVQRDNGTWLTVFEGKDTIDLMAFSGAQAKAKLADFHIAAGHYQKLRIAVSEVRVTQLDGTERLLNVFGNVVTIASDFTVDPTNGVQILVDFDLDQGLDLAAGTFTPKVLKIQVADQEGDVSDAEPEQDPEQEYQNEADIPDLHDGEYGQDGEQDEDGQVGQACDNSPSDAQGDDDDGRDNATADENETADATDENETAEPSAAGNETREDETASADGNETVETDDVETEDDADESCGDSDDSQAQSGDGETETRDDQSGGPSSSSGPDGQDGEGQ